MRFFIVKDENASYFYNLRLGILRKNLHSLHSPTEIYPAGKDNFALCTMNGTHIVCANRDNDIVYIKYPKKPCIILPGKPDVVPYNFTLTVSDNKLNLFYLTDYKDKVFLYHCVLEKSSHPVVAAELSAELPQYYCNFNRLYYVSPENLLLFKAINNNFDNSFTKICKNGSGPCYTEFNNKSFLTYKKDDTIYLNDYVVTKDKYANCPVVFATNNALYVEWLSENRIRYRRYENDTVSDIIECIGSDTKPHIINIISNGHNNPCYGCNGRPSIKF